MRLAAALFLLATVPVPGRTLPEPAPGLLTPLQVTAMTPSPGSIQNSAPSEIVVTFSGDILPETITASTFQLRRAGQDGLFGTADDVAITPASVAPLGTNQAKMSLTGVSLPNDLYQVRLSGSEAPIASADLVSYWKLDEGSGTSTADASSSGNNGTITGPTWTTGKIGAALHFNGDTDRVVTAAADLPAPWTASLWVKREDSPNGDARLLDSETYGVGTSLRLEQFGTSGNVGFTIYGSQDKKFGYVAPVGTWVHLAFVSNGASITLYANGILADQIVTGASLSRYHLGSHGSNTLLGALDDVRIYNGALTLSEVQSLAQLGHAVRDTTGAILDGEYAETLPSGDGTPGGDFVATFTIQTVAPTAPTGLSSSATEPHKLDLAWTDNSFSESGFKIERSTDGVGFSQIAIVPTGSTAYTDQGLAPATLYYHRVRAYNAVGNSGYSNITGSATISASATLRVTETSFVPGTVLSQAPETILVTFNTDVDPNTVTKATVRLARAGEDGIFGTADDVAVEPISLTMPEPNQVSITLNALSMVNDHYHLILSGAQSSLPYENLLHHWALDEATGSTAADSTGSGYDGTLSGPSWTAGKVGGALQFGGGQDRVTIGAGDLALPWTATMWVKRADSPAVDSRLMDSEGFGTGASLRLEQYKNTNQVGFTIYGSQDVKFGYTAPVGEWIHLAFASSGTGTSLYVNGILMDNVGAVTPLSRFHLGSHGENSLVGVLDEVRIYGADLGAGEILSLATFGGAVAAPGGLALDGEFSGSFPSGNGTPGGDLVVNFSVNSDLAQVPSTLVATTLSPTQIELTWQDNSDDETGFEVERSLDKIAWTQITVTGADVASFIDAGTKSDAIYFYRVRAVNEFGASAWSNIAQSANAVAAAFADSSGGGGGSCGSVGLDLLLLPILFWYGRRGCKRACKRSPRTGDSARFSRGVRHPRSLLS